MKTWENAVLEEINISATQYGAGSGADFDAQWKDANGALHVTFGTSES